MDSENQSRPASEAHECQSDQSQPRRSRRSSSIVLVPNMVTPSADSCIQLTAQKDPAETQKRPAVPASESVQSDSDCTNDSATKAQAKGRRKAKNNCTATASTSGAGTAIVKTSNVATSTKKGVKAKEKKSKKRVCESLKTGNYD